MSDVVDNASNNDTSNDRSDEDMSNEEDEETEVDVFFCNARSIMNRTLQKVGTAAMESLLLRLLWRVEGDQPHGVRHAGGGWPAPQEVQAQASALGSLFFKGLSKGGPRMLRCW